MLADRRQKLLDNWMRLTSRFETPEESVEAVFADLVKRYAEPHRFYHTLEHLAEVLSILQVLLHQALDPVAVELAAWFHDAIYDPRAGDNEEQSAAYAAEALEPLGVSPDTVQATKALILRTKDHLAPAGDVDSPILLDADLAILGATEPRYDAYAQAIRQEYAWVPEEQYRAGRRQVLERFLRRERIFLTEEWFATLERPARRNLTRERDAWRQG
jgi:predicted metal-dependent HD superfamily phosphohydrolase